MRRSIPLLTQIFRKLKEHLPGFTELNWTSCLRHYAKFPRCDEGPSDFVYEGDMEAVKQLFQLHDFDGNWKTVYIEVKATFGEKRDFHLSNCQFERVNFSNSIVDIRLKGFMARMSFMLLSLFIMSYRSRQYAQFWQILSSVFMRRILCLPRRVVSPDVGVRTMQPCNCRIIPRFSVWFNLRQVILILDVE